MSYTISSRTERAHEKAASGVPFRGYATVGIAPDEDAYAALMRAVHVPEKKSTNIYGRILWLMRDNRERTLSDIMHSLGEDPKCHNRREVVRSWLRKLLDHGRIVSANIGPAQVYRAERNVGVSK